MKIVYSKNNLKHDPTHEFRRGKKVKAFEKANRAKSILNEFRSKGYGKIIEPDNAEVPIKAIHDDQYITFLQEIHTRWVSQRLEGELIPYCWPKSEIHSDIPKDIFGQIGFFAGDSDTPIVKGTWLAAYSSAACAATAARQITKKGERFAFAITRPPGHHASTKTYSGYCYLNNAAIACTQLKTDGFGKIALLDIDYHHGNGSQAIFESRSDVFYVSLHANPDYEYPFFSGRVHEIGIGEGEGYTKNYPLELGIGWREYEKALTQAIIEIDKYRADALVISLGVDTSGTDPLGKFKLFDEAYCEMGVLLASIKLPTVFVLEGGYDYSSIGRHVHQVLSNFEHEITNERESL